MECAMNTPAPKTSGFAVSSLVFGILGICCPIIGSLIAVICGHIALGTIKKSGGAVGGKGVAVTGLAFGYLAILLWIIALAFAVPASKGFGDKVMDLVYAQQIQRGMLRMAEDGESKGDKSLGWPADAGITTVSELKKRLLDGGYIDQRYAADIDFEKFMFGNVSKDDPDSTIFIQMREPFLFGVTLAVGKDGESQEIAPGENADAPVPPREPAFLAP